MIIFCRNVETIKISMDQLTNLEYAGWKNNKKTTFCWVTTFDISSTVIEIDHITGNLFYARDWASGL